jgi:hypothetical protein
MTPTTAALVFGLAGLALATVGAWFGGELIDRLGVGAERGADLNAPSSLTQGPMIKFQAGCGGSGFGVRSYGTHSQPLVPVYRLLPALL